MRFSLNIDYPLEKMAANRRRMEAREAFKYVDRVPVGLCLAPRFFTPLFGIPYSALFKSVEEQYHWQLQFLKYRIENIPEDMICTSTKLFVTPYLDNVMDSEAFGAEVTWPENETLQTRPTIGSPEQMDRFEAPPPGTGLWGQARDWWLEMRQFTRETRLTFNGKVEGQLDVGILGIGWSSPHMIAVDLVGPDFYWWLVEYPESCHRFLAKITAGSMAAQRNFMTIDDRPRGYFCLAEDCAQIMSVHMFRQFCVPYANQLYEAFGTKSRAMHMCGPSTHLHQALVEDLRITAFEAFGHMVEPEVAARNLGGRMALWGNVDPLRILNGSREDVKQTARVALEYLAPCGGFLLGDGANICPGTPLTNLAAFVEASEEYGLPEKGVNYLVSQGRF